MGHVSQLTFIQIPAINIKRITEAHDAASKSERTFVTDPDDNTRQRRAFQFSHHRNRFTPIHATHNFEIKMRIVQVKSFLC